MNNMLVWMDISSMGKNIDFKNFDDRGTNLESINAFSTQVPYNYWKTVRSSGEYLSYFFSTSFVRKFLREIKQ